MDKVALVTGSSKGIGKAIAKRLSKEGYFVYITYNTDKKGGESLVKEIGEKKSSLVKLNVRDEAEVKATFKKVKKENYHLNVLVNNAGIEIPKRIEDLSLDEWNTVVETKINGAFLCTKYAVSLMKEQDNPNIINITSGLGSRPDPDYPAYCTGTAGLDALTTIFALDFSRYKIRTNAIAPGPTLTPMWDTMGGDDPKLWKKFAESNPLGRVSTPEDIAETVMIIINDKTKFLNGNTFFVIQ